MISEHQRETIKRYIVEQETFVSQDFLSKQHYLESELEKVKQQLKEERETIDNHNKAFDSQKRTLVE